MKKIVVFCFLLLTISGTSQTFPKKYVDSLTAVALSKKSIHPLKLNRDKALQELWLASKPADRIAIFYDIVAYSDELTPERSLYYHKLILEGAKKRGDKVLEASVLAELGFITSRNGNTAEGLRMLYKALELAENTGNAQAIGIVYNNLGNCYPNNRKLSKEYYLKALENSRKGNDYLFTSFNLGNLADKLMQEQKKDSAISLYIESYKLAVEKNLEPAIPIALLDLSFFDKKENKLQYYRQTSQMPFTIRNSGMKSSIDSRYAKYYMEQKRMDSALYFAKQVYNNAKTADLTLQLNALALMGDYYRALPNTDSTLSYLERFYTLKDSLYGDKVVEQAQTMAYNDMQRQKELEAQNIAFKNRMMFYFLSAIAFFLIILAFIFWRSKRKEQQAKAMVQKQNDDLAQTLDKLKATQSQLIQSEKMVSLGELTAGIAHEIQNPLNFVNNFSEVSMELIDEMEAEMAKGDTDEAIAIATDIKQNLEKINYHGKRADGIVKGMLQHSRSSSGIKEPTDINKLADEYLRLAYHGLRAKDKSFNATIKTDYDETIGTLTIIPQDMGRVILNLITNAFYVVDEKRKQIGEGYEPTVSVSTKKVGDEVTISVKDNGNGIPQKVLDKIFQPFFTTKPTGQGTGLGLSLSYDIVKAHNGELKVETKEGEGTEFYITLPL
jgi:two-component system NtrC family sensor kinase